MVLADPISHINKFVPGITSKYISQFSRPLSPHLAAKLDNDVSIPRSDASILSKVKDHLSKHATDGGRYAVLETAGGVLSPGPSGTVQGDLYRPLRLPTILVGDSKLGGIATTISAFESLHVRGYDVDCVLLFDDPEWGNYDYLARHFMKHDISTFALPKPPERHDKAAQDNVLLQNYYDMSSELPATKSLLEILNQKHFNRISSLTCMPSKADGIIWHPFRQHGIPHNIIAIDSAYNDHFQTFNAETDQNLMHAPSPSSLTPLPTSTQSLLTPQFDASASWWTQGLGHGNPSLALTAAHASGRYGHVMFAHAIHEPALNLSYNLLETLQNPRLSRVFFTDNGSTGMEVAVKMALRASCARYGWNPKSNSEPPVEILGLRGSYHGDTIGVMNCSEESVFNKKVDWHRPWGHWFDPPTLIMRKGVWELDIPGEFRNAETLTFESLSEVFDFDARVGDTARYEEHIKSTLTELVQKQGRRFGALILEPIIMGAGGMIFVDPLFQRTLIKTIRQHPELIAPQPPKSHVDNGSGLDWSGIPIIADEVFTGLYRLGRASSSSFLSGPSDFTASLHHSCPVNSSQPRLPVNIAPDISCHAKLLTAGLLPLALTTASESIFNAFLSDDKTDALLHGHSYTAHAVGCMVANKALDEYRRLDSTSANGLSENDRDGTWSTSNDTGSWDTFKAKWTSANAANASGSDTRQQIYSFHSPQALKRLSQHSLVSGCFALGTVLVLKLAPPSGSSSGYTSTATSTLQARLLTTLDSQFRGIHSRVLGDIIYFMTSLTTSPEEVESLGRGVLKALDAEADVQGIEVDRGDIH
jgi:bifunctional dethiobiotin synthetase / adenosylmethionine---8-amino-7-oxononanoate aminotransferase